jgi:F-type H+-transporting ATPase subunit epsilon
MDNAESKTFHCRLIDPMGKLLDCQTNSVVLPAHDGQVGILYNHMPMLCQLGLGIMRVNAVSEDQYKGHCEGEVSFFIDGGFALIAANSVMVVAYDALALQDLKPERLESVIERTLSREPATAGAAQDRRIGESLIKGDCPGDRANNQSSTIDYR